MMGIMVCLVFLFVGVSFLLLAHFCVGGGPLRWSFNPINIPHRSRNVCYNNNRSGIDLEKLPCYDFKAGEKDSSPVDCAVCLENLKVGDKCRLLPRCKHTFHSQCIDSWLLKTPVCPLCRTSANSKKISLVPGEESSQPSEAQVESRERQHTVDENRLSTSTPSTVENSPTESNV